MYSHPSPQEKIQKLILREVDRVGTLQATGIAALHACFMRGTLPYYMQIPQEKHAWNTCVNKYMQKYITEKIYAN